MLAKLLDPQLTLKSLLNLTDIAPDDVIFIRHTFGSPEFPSPEYVTEETLFQYTRSQAVASKKFPQNPPRYWFVFLAETGGQSRLYTVYENHGEILEERTESHRYFDLHQSSVFAGLRQRLLIEWTKDFVNWSKMGKYADKLKVLEIAPRRVKEFPGYDNLLLNYSELQKVVSEDPMYVKWRAALGAVQGIYLIIDTISGQQYVGKADGNERILGRWRAYAGDGHGGNVAMRELKLSDSEYAQRYQFSLLRVFGPQTPQVEVDRAESHYKQALLSRKFGLNRN